MNLSPVARRYARALHQNAEAAGQREAVGNDVALVRETLDGSRELALLFASPVVDRDRKRAVVERLFSDRVSATTLDLFRLLVEKDRIALLGDVMRAYAQLEDEHAGRIEAHVRSALPLGGEEAQALERRLAELTGHTVRLRIDIDPDLIGGVVVRIGDTVYDGSARHQLERLREQFAEGIYLSTN